MSTISGNVSLVALAGNAFILTAIWKNVSLRNPSYFLLAGLAVTDFATGLIIQPLYAAYMLLKFNEKTFPCIATTIFHTTDRYFAGVAMETITVMAIERWLHMSRRFLITMRRTHRIYGVLLFLPVILTSARVCLISVNESEFREIGEPLMRGILGGFCFLTTSFSYVKVFNLIRRHQRQVQASQSSRNHVQQAINLEKYKKSVYTIFFIVLIFLLCFVPNIIGMSVMLLVNVFTEPFSVFFHVSYTPFYLSSSLNPLLYCCRIKEIRDEVKLMICKML